MHFFQIEVQMISNPSSRLEKNPYFLLMNDFYEFFKKGHFPHFFDIFENNQLHILKSLYAFYFMQT